MTGNWMMRAHAYNIIRIIHTYIYIRIYIYVCMYIYRERESLYMHDNERCGSSLGKGQVFDLPSTVQRLAEASSLMCLAHLRQEDSKASERSAREALSLFQAPNEEAVSFCSDLVRTKPTVR